MAAAVVNPNATSDVAFAPASSSLPADAGSAPTTAGTAPSRFASPAATTPTTAAASTAPPQRAPSGAPAAAGCDTVLAAASTRTSTRRADIVALVRAGTLGPVPLSGYSSPAVQPYRYETPTQYVSDVAMVDPAATATALSTDGFVAGELTDFRVGSSKFSADVLRFATPAGASAYQRSSLDALCRAGSMAAVRTLPAVSGGAAFVSSLPSLMPFQAAFVARDSVVHLSICHCVEAPDQFALVAQWAEVVAHQVGAA